MRQVRFRGNDGAPVAINTHAVTHVSELKRGETLIAFTGGGRLVVEGSFAEVADRIFADAEDEHHVPL